MTKFLIIGAVSSKEEATEISMIAKNAIVRRRVKELARGTLK